MSEREFCARLEEVRAACLRDARRFGARGEDLADIWQDACIAAWRHHRTYDPQIASFVRWMLVITRRVAVNYYRHTTGSRGIYGPSLPLMEAALVWAREDAAADVAAADLQRRLLARLTPKQRALLRGRLAGFTFEEIGAVIGHGRGHAVKIRTQIQRVWRQMEMEG